MPVLKMRSEKCGMRNRDARAASLVPRSAFPVPHSVCSQGVSSSARRFAKAEARGASPRESAMFKLGTKNAKRGTKQTRFSDSAFPIPRSAPYSPLCLSSHRSGFVNRHSSVRVRPGAPVYGDHDVISSITPREGVCAGANPVGHPNFIPLAEQFRRRFAKPQRLVRFQHGIPFLRA